MGYELHIKRLDNWDDFEEESKITLEEWLAYVESDNELELTNGYQIKIPGIIDSYQSVPGYCTWNEHPTMRDADKPWFDYGCGCVSTKNPDEPTIKKMIEIAARLKAKVRGDDGEFYDDTYFINLEKQNAKKEPTKKKPWWKF